MKNNLTSRTNKLLELINQARATLNPFSAKELKSVIEPQVQPLLIDVVEQVEANKGVLKSLVKHGLEQQEKINKQTNQLEDLQRQLANFDTRLSGLGG